MTDGGGGGMHEGRGSTPIPDPTVLTSMLVDKAIANLREILEAQISGQKELFQARFDEAEKATRLLQDIFDRVPMMMDEKVSHLAKLGEEKFAGVERSFEERDTRSEREARDNKTAIDAALLAQKEAVRLQTEASALATAKSEAATMKQTDQLVTQLQTSTKALDDKIAELGKSATALLQAETKALTGEIANVKERLTLIEGKSTGRVENVVEHRASATDTRGLVGMLVGLAGIAFVAVDVLARAR
jgi:hypothetical protein